MLVRAILLTLCFSGLPLAGQASGAGRPAFEAFEVATIKPADEKLAGRYIKMQTPTRFFAHDYPLKLLIAAAYDLNSKAIAGGPAWVDATKYDITAKTPGDLQPNHAEQMRMLRALLVERFGLTFHREPREMSMYAMRLAKGGAKLNPSTAAPGDPVVMGPGVVYPGRVSLPARNASMDDFVSLLQRAILDRPVVDQTGLTGGYDFTFEWAPDETQFDGSLSSADGGKVLPLFDAIQQELGLRLEAMRGQVSVFVIDRVSQPSAN
jgi:uncharacterized protein (TIGR03435 family)